ncbi:ABC transporter ATP-binding protein [Natronococcus roseus]|uniref:ABC transporter ATP-binding protein n=1 Tax=Natronococcus roseus TaxID=1052014 RepID=UPI00374DAB00
MAVIELEGLTKDYGEVVANDSLEFAVERGEIFGFLGPNGAGKTTTIRMLLGFISPTSGTARVLGEDVREERSLLEAKRRIGYLSDEPGFDEQQTGTDVLDLHASIKGDSRREELLELFDPPVERRIREYSQGNARKLGIVTAFMHDPDLVILDEPTNGLDPLIRQRFADFLRAERQRGVTVFFSSHNLSEVRRLCDRVGIIREGKLVTIEPVDALLRRSGKVVRIRSADPIPIDALDLEGVHDLETSVSDSHEGTDPSTAFTECVFTFTGDINALLPRLADDELIDLAIEEAPLEDVFMRFYGGEEDV